MKWKINQKSVDTNWHSHFAWLPVKTENGYRVWLETVERKYKMMAGGGKYVYRTV